MAESWVRLWSGMTTDPKWQTVARKSGQPRSLVIALFTHLMLEANDADERGSLADVDVEDVASALDCDEEAVVAILEAMEGRFIKNGRVIEDPRRPIFVQAPDGRLPIPEWMRARARVFERDEYTCQYCGAQGVPLECDHVFPISKGGSNEDANLVAACVPCNRSKGAMTLEQWRAKK